MYIAETWKQRVLELLSPIASARVLSGKQFSLSKEYHTIIMKPSRSRVVILVACVLHGIQTPVVSIVVVVVIVVVRRRDHSSNRKHLPTH
jgi:hypothetical protein